MEQTLIDRIDAACARYANRDCLIFGNKRYTYKEIAELSCRIANALIADGFCPGMLGAVLSPNHPLAFVATLGIIRAGGVWVPINPRSSGDEILAIFNSFGCDALFHHASQQQLVERINQHQPPPRISKGIEIELFNWIADRSSAAPKVDRKAEDPVMAPMTGGTTGTPKAVALSNRNLIAILDGVTALDSSRERLVNLAAAPMTHVGGRIVFTVMNRGGTTVVLEGFDPDQVFDAIEKHGVTDLFLPPTAIYSLLDHPRAKTTDYASLHSIAYGSAPMSIDKLKLALNIFGPVMVGGFGQTEAPLLITRMTQSDHFIDRKVAPDQRLRSVGRATPASKVAIMGDNGALLPQGELGEIVVKGAFVSEGYYRNPIATAEVRRDGWHLTGDIGYLDPDGFLYIVDRKKDMIITGGFNVYSAEVERIVSAMPGVRECAVIGVPDEHWGEAVKAVIQPDIGITLDAKVIIAECRSRLGPVKAPKSIDFVDDLPRNANSKVDKKAIRGRYWASVDRLI